MWVSFSTLAAYRACPRQFYLERVLGLVLDRRESGEEGYPEGGPREEVLDQDERGAGRDVGILVHRLLERLLPEEVRPPMDSLGEAAEKAVLELGLQLGPPDMERALHLCAAAWISPVAENLRHPSVLREAPFAFAHGDAVVSGVMDAVRMDGDCWQVVDYKTNALGGRSVSELAEAYSLQAEVYCLAALRAGAEAVRMDLVFLERPEEPATARYGGEDLQLLEGSLDSALSGLRLREYPASLGPACARCAVAGVCQGMIGT